MIIEPPAEAHRLLIASGGLVKIADGKVVQSQKAQGDCLWIVRSNGRYGPVYFGIVEGKHPLVMFYRSNKLAAFVQARAHGLVSCQPSDRIIVDLP